MSKEGLCVKPEKDTIIPMVDEAGAFGDFLAASKRISRITYLRQKQEE